jgi:hypothetical protein
MLMLAQERLMKFQGIRKKIENYKKALKLNPKSEHTRMKIDNLNKSE